MLFLGPEPVLMVPRAIGPAAPLTGGRAVELRVGEATATLFIPHDRKPGSRLWVHFHTAAWFIVQEHQRAGMKEPVLVFNLGQGSSVYGKPFEAVGSFGPWLKSAETEMGFEVGSLGFTSFSAGFGAVRNLIQDPAVLSKLSTVIQCDSLYGSLESPRVVLPAHVEAWRPLVQKARRGEATVIFTCAMIRPETYAGTFEVARAIAAAEGVPLKPVDEVPGEQRLLERYEDGRWFAWIYAGETPEAHMTHARRLAELLIESEKR